MLFRSSSYNFTQTICAGKSYFFNNINRNTAGTYKDTLVNNAGCDSIITLNLVLNPTTSYNFTQTICAGKSYFFNNTNRNTAGTYKDTLSNSKFCDSIVTLNLKVIIPVTAAVVNISICSGTTIVVYGVSRGTAGTYKDTLLSRNGCDSVYVSTKITLKPTPTVSVPSKNYSICYGERLFIDATITGAFVSGWTDSALSTIYPDPLNVVITQNKTFIVAGGNLSLCYDRDTVRVRVIPLLPITKDTISICNGNTINLHGKIISTAGLYKDTLNSRQGCDSIIHTIVKILPIKTTNQTVNICTGQSWNGKNVAGIYRDTFATNNCDSVVVTNLLIDSILLKNQTVNICTGQSWNGKNTAGIYRDTFATNNCDSVVVTNLVVNNASTTNQTVNICTGQSWNGKNIAGIYRDTFATNNCDSVVVTNLLIDNILLKNQTVNICTGQSWNGKNTAGIYRDTFATNNCDSIIVTNLIIDSWLST